MLIVLVRRLDILLFLDKEASVLSSEILGVRSKGNSFESQFIASLGQGQARAARCDRQLLRERRKASNMRAERACRGIEDISHSYDLDFNQPGAIN